MKRQGIGEVVNTLGAQTIAGAKTLSNVTSMSTSGQITSTVATGTAPLVIASTTKVTNLNADLLDGYSTGATGNGIIPYTDGSGLLSVGTSGNAATATTATTATNLSGGTITNATNVSYTGTLTGGTGVIAIGTNQFYKDASGNVGIGTGSPNLGTLTINKDGNGLAIRNADTNYSALISGVYTAGTEAFIQSTKNGTGTQLPLNFYIGNNKALAIDVNSNVGIGVTPKTYSTGKAIDVGSAASIFAYDSKSAHLVSNMYYNGGWKYKNALSNGGYYSIYDGAHSWVTATGNQGADNAPTTIASAMTLDASGTLTVQKNVTDTTPVNNADSYSSTYPAIMALRRSKSDTVGTMSATTTNDNLGRLSFYGVNSSNAFAMGANINAVQTSTGTANIGAAINVNVYAADGSGDFANAQVVYTSGASGAIGTASINAKNTAKAWVNFNGTANTNATGTYSQSGTTNTVTVTAHGMTAGDLFYISFSSGTGVAGVYTVLSVTNANVFTYTAGTSLTTSGNCTLVRSTIRKSFNISSVADNGTGDYSINFTADMADANYVVNANARVPAATSNTFSATRIFGTYSGSTATDVAPTVHGFRMATFNYTSVATLADADYVMIEVFN